MHPHQPLLAGLVRVELRLGLSPLPVLTACRTARKLSRKGGAGGRARPAPRPGSRARPSHRINTDLDRHALERFSPSRVAASHGGSLVRRRMIWNGLRDFGLEGSGSLR